jgi:glycosyltransferase involved in cell wall biosynthesis
LNVTDACFVSFLPAKILETGSPNKYFDALAAGKLVITNFKGWVKDEVEHEECGVYVDALDSSTFPKVIRPFVEDRQRWKAYSENARRLAERKYSRRQLGLRFCDVLSNSSGQVASRLSYV